MSAAVIAGLAYYWHLSTGGTGGPAIVVPTTTVTRGDVQDTLRVTGTLAAKNKATILAPRIQGSRTDTGRGGTANMTNNRMAMAVGGGANLAAGFGAAQMTDFSLILTKLANAGAHVKAGDVVAQFDTLLQEQRLDDYKDSLVQLDANIKNAMANMAAQKESHLQQVRSAKAAWDTAVLNQQTNPVVAAVNAQLYDVAVEQAKAQYEQLVYEDDLLAQQLAARVEAIQLNRDQAQRELQSAESNLKRMTLKSPMDGFVVMASLVRNGEFGTMRIGDQVRPGQPIMYIEDPRSMVVDADLNQVDAESVRIGMKAVIHIDAYDDIALPGTLDGLSAMAKNSTFRADYVSLVPLQIELEKTDPRVVPDLTASAEILLNSESNTLFVPREAVFKENGQSYVFARDADGWVRKPVHTGLVSATRVAIHSGLSQGDVVALQRPT